MTDQAMSRLRAANPFPATATDDAALFERITAGLRNEGGRRRGRSTRLVIVLALLAAVLLASTAWAISNWIGGDVVKPPVTRAEYAQAQNELVLPPGYHWPTLNVDPNSVTTRGGGGGHAVVIAQNAWECFWVQAIHDGDRPAQQRAYGELRKLLAHNILVAPAGASDNWAPPNPPRGPYAVFADDGGFEWIRAGYAQAAAGHPARIEASCRANRPG